MEKLLARFGLTSISVAEFGSFIQTEFNHQARALELVTIGPCLSLAHAIMHGEEVDEDSAEADTSTIEDTSQAVERRVRRVPSAFVKEFQDHFPKRPDIESRNGVIHQI